MRAAWLALVVLLCGCDDELYYADGTPWRNVDMPLRSPQVALSEMTARQQARYFASQGIQADGVVKEFPPTWNGFSTDPVGKIKYYDYGSIVQMWVDDALTGVSDEAFMLLTGVPESIRPRASRYVRCLLLNESDLRAGVVLITDAGGMAFSLETVEAVPTDSIGFNNVFTTPSALGFKGLPSGWLITYVK